LSILLGQAQAVLLAHVEVGAGDHAADGWARHDLLGLEVDLGQARTILPAFYRQPAETEIAAVAVDRSEGFIFGVDLNRAAISAWQAKSGAMNYY